MSNLASLGPQDPSTWIARIAISFATPVLEARRMQAQEHILIAAMNNRRESQADIMHTVRDLAANGELTPEALNTLMMVYMQLMNSTP